MPERTSHPAPRLRAALPQVLTGCPIACGAAALVVVSSGDAYLAATWITLGAVTDGLYGAAARWLDESTPFGIWFDYLSDYMCYIVASWNLARAIVPGSGVVHGMLLGVPLVTGAIRYARNGATTTTHALDLNPATAAAANSVITTDSMTTV